LGEFPPFAPGQQCAAATDKKEVPFAAATVAASGNDGTKIFMSCSSRSFYEKPFEAVRRPCSHGFEIAPSFIDFGGGLNNGRDRLTWAK
jgi:hypothetical protein